ncbi:DegT/DnrJ/EryC1/StrS family aminotransferase [Verrucomicrobia bacterium]|nr:DegT/DnrJ/EryC1/StrS family aminotransferase [Verrucomicrobiota bacterium]
MPILGLLGGKAVINQPFSPSKIIGKEEIAIATEVLNSGNLSGFFGSWSERFYGGPQVRNFEKEWADLFEVEHAVSFNSWTSGLVAAVGAIGISPGDEVIVSPWTMTASAAAILAWNAIPVFADVNRETYNLCAESVIKTITPRTKAIMMPLIFGSAEGLTEVKKIAQEHGLILIEDAAQTPYVHTAGRWAGTIGDIGGFSLNYHKHIHTGEGGMAVTDNAEYAEKMRLIRNHGEAVVEDKGEKDITNCLGFNFRLGEIEAAIGRVQLGKLPSVVQRRFQAGKKLAKMLEKLPGVRLPLFDEDMSHAFYVFAIGLDLEVMGVSRDTVVAALQAEGVPWIYGGYQNIHLQPMYQRKIAYGRDGFPWNLHPEEEHPDYEKGICPVAEKLHDQEVICLQICQHDYDAHQTELVGLAFLKVWKNLEELRAWESAQSSTATGNP